MGPKHRRPVTRICLDWICSADVPSGIIVAPFYIGTCFNFLRVVPVWGPGFYYSRGVEKLNRRCVSSISAGGKIILAQILPIARQNGNCGKIRQNLFTLFYVFSESRQNYWARNYNIKKSIRKCQFILAIR
jgi:hypothetical protein